MPSILLIGAGLGLNACSPLDIALHGADFLGQGVVSLIGKHTSSATQIYCQSPNTTNVYETYSDTCRQGDEEIKSWQYAKLDAQNKEVTAAAERAAAEVAKAAPTYCLTSLSHTPYEAKSGKRMPDERQITKSDYDEQRSQASATVEPPAITLPKPAQSSSR